MFSTDDIKRRVLVELRDDAAFRRALATLIADDIREALK